MLWIKMFDVNFSTMENNYFKKNLIFTFGNKLLLKNCCNYLTSIIYFCKKKSLIITTKLNL